MTNPLGVLQVQWNIQSKVDAGFELMQKLGIEYFCFHDVDLIPEYEDIIESFEALDVLSDYILER